MNLEKGITLIALVITIIVLLILAGITISLVFGNNGIINRAKQAEEDHIKAMIKEEIQFGILDIESELSSKNPPESLSAQKIISQIMNKMQEPIVIKNDLTGEYKGFAYWIDEEYVVHIGNKITDKTTQLLENYIGTRGFTIEVKTTHQDITSYNYYIDEIEQKEKQNILAVDNLTPETVYKVKVMLNNSKGQTVETIERMIKTKPITYLYNEGDEATQIVGGFNSQIRSYNSYYTSEGVDESIWFDGNGSYSSGVVTKNEDSINMTATHNGSGSQGYGNTIAGIITQNLVDLSQYKKLYIEGSFTTNNNSSSLLELIDQNGEKDYSKWTLGKICEEVDLTNKNGKYYIRIGVNSTATLGITGNMKITSIKLEE